MRHLLVLLSMLVASVGVAQEPESPPPGAEAATTAAAEGPSEADLARARVRFREGVSAAERGDYASAAQAFRDALAVRDAVAVRFNLASALFELGEDAEAFRLARELQSDPGSPSELRERAAFLERELRDRNAVISVQLGGLADGARLGDRDLTQEELGTPLLVAPGEVELLGLRGAEIVTRRSLQLPRGGDVYVDVSVVPTPGELARDEAERERDRAVGNEPTERSRTGLYVGVAAAVVAVAAVVVVAVVITRDGTQSPVGGDFQPGVIRW